MKLIFYTANCIGNAKNCSYPNRLEVTTAEELKAVVKIDHVCGEYKNNYRSADNFVKSVVTVMDCDNDHSENPDEWVTPEKIDGMLPDVSYAIAPSRNHMKKKDDKTARPRFHVYFLINPCKDAIDYVRIKRRIQKAFPFFDGNALDVVRFIFGADCDEVVWHDGWETIEEELPVFKDEAETTGYSSIPEGKRNNTLSRFAGRVVKRYGATEKAQQIFLDEAKKCDPPMEADELTTIWSSAVKFAKKAESQEGYVAPNDFNDDFECLTFKFLVTLVLSVVMPLGLYIIIIKLALKAVFKVNLNLSIGTAILPIGCATILILIIFMVPYNLIRKSEDFEDL
jgi:putative DNA primase/helicase